jgi:hypothetical protein
LEFHAAGMRASVNDIMFDPSALAKLVLKSIRVGYQFGNGAIFLV